MPIGALTVGKRAAAPLALLTALIASAIAVVYTTHLNRQAFNQYQQLLDERDALNVEWGQLLLEQSALAAHARVEQIAIRRLDMKVPDIKERVLVKP